MKLASLDALAYAQYHAIQELKDLYSQVPDPALLRIIKTLENHHKEIEPLASELRYLRRQVTYAKEGA